MHVGMRLPGIDQHRQLIGERGDLIADGELRVIAGDFQQHMAMRMGMAHQAAIHVEQRHAAKGPVRDPQRLRHFMPAVLP